MGCYIIREGYISESLPAAIKGQVVCEETGIIFDVDHIRPTVPQFGYAKPNDAKYKCRGKVIRESVNNTPQ